MKVITHTPTEAVLDVLRRSRCEGDRLHLPEQLDRKLYLEVMKALELLGGAWIRKWKCHVFDGEDAQALIADALATGTLLDLKKTYQFYPTPPIVVDAMIALADFDSLRPERIEPRVEDRPTLLEPSAGDGAIIRGVPLGANVNMFACELQTREALARLHETRRIEIIGCDFLDLPTRYKFDRIIANPPFARGQEIVHASKMLQHLKPGGRLVTVLSPAWTFNQSALHTSFRQRLEEADVESKKWIPLPPDSFKESGTSVRAGILVVQMRGAS